MISDDDFLDGFLEEHGGADMLSELARAIPPRKPPAGLRERLLGSAAFEGRFERFAASVSEMLDLPMGAAQALLDRLSDEGVWSQGIVPSMQIYHVQGGQRVEGAITGFVRLGRGAVFPEHEHLGLEEVLILQGSCLDSVGQRVLRAGDRAQMAKGTSHSFEVREGPDFLYLAIVFNGLRINGQDLLADDPRV